ncbi:Hpt domain-containing protein [Pseudoxanthomonas sangjuensis]|uniref:Hpt domain-containing protein n=1 Tax=Pseudoxanthomonas sangjuensis TaxID=1503750 RepID=UPI001FEC776F|nr:Hpt domain-containing protein [Pseudoxanthomonas sangjuensis]
MNALRDAMSQAALGWVKPELDETLRLARAEVEFFAEDPNDTARMHLCAGYLHQVQGTLQMVELYAPAMVAEELELLAQSLHDGKAADRDEACATLMRGTVLLPDYLERLQGGHRDIPIVLLPLLNDIRAARGAPGLSESVLFAPDLDRPLPTSVPLPEPMPWQARRGRIDAARQSFEQALAGWPEGGAPRDPVGLAAALKELSGSVEKTVARRSLWVAASVAEALRDGALAASDALRQGFAGLGRALQHWQQDGADVDLPPGQEPTRQLLYAVAQSSSRHPALDELRATFQLDAAAPSEAEVDHARSSISGRNRALFDTVGGVVKEELMRVKDALDLHMRTGADIAALQPQVGELSSVADTLGMLGLGAARDVVLQQRDALSALVAGQRRADEGALLNIAGALLYVDASLDSQVANLGAAGSHEEGAHATDAQHTIGALAQEAIANFAAAREGFVAFIETGWDHAELAEVPRLLAEVAGALRILDLAQAADYVEGVRRYVGNELIGRRRVPGGQQLDTLADAMASLEYYLEALRDKRPNQGDILDITRSSLEALRYWPLPPELAVEETVAAEEEPEPAAAEEAPAPVPAAAMEPPAVAAGLIEPSTAALVDAVVARAAPAPTLVTQPPETADAVPATAIGPEQGGFDTRSGDIDDEIREVFLEEFDEEIANLERLLPTWRAAPDDLEKLRPIRRVFHTLKGSGRLVGAGMLGEFSWKIENMLNRVLDGSRPPSEAVLALLGQASDTLPQLNAALHGRKAVWADIEGIKEVADRIAAGEDAFYTAPVGLPRFDEPAPAPAAAPVAAAPPLDGTPAQVDGVLREILETEVANHLETVHDWLARAESAPQPASEALLRAFHTMNGAFAMADVPEIPEVTGAAEQYLKRLLPANVPVSDAGVVALAESAQAISGTMAALRTPAPRVPVFAELAARLSALRDSLPPAPVAAEPPAGAYVEALPPIAPPLAPDALELAELVDNDLSAYLAAPEPGAPAGAAAPTQDRQPEAVEPFSDEAAGIADIGYDAASFEVEEISLEDADGQPGVGIEEIALEPAGAELQIEEISLASAEPVAEAEPSPEAHDVVPPLAPDDLQVEEVVLEDAATPEPAVETGIVEAEAVEAEAIEAGATEETAIQEPVSEQAAAEEAAAEEAAAEEAATEEAATEEAATEEAATEGMAVEEAAAEAEPVAAEPAVELPPLKAPVLAPEPAPQPAVMADIDAGELDAAELDLDLVDIFAEEGADLLDHSDGVLAKLREAPDDRNLVLELQRDLHTLKGGARMAGINAIGDLGHSIESLLEQVAAQRVDLGLDGVRALERGFDRLHALLAKTSAHRAVKIPAELIAEFNARSEGRSLPVPGAADAGPAHAPELAPLSAPVEIGEAVAEPVATEQAATPAVAADTEFFPQASQEQVRIRADLLDRLVNYAGEVAIYRARLEQQLGAFRGAMAELDRTNTRLHDQLRRLDLETEAQIVARYQREQDRGDPAFDPLELDRFSTLQQLSRALAESAADLTGLQGVLDDLSRQYDSLLQQQSRVSSELQDGLMRARMVPFDGLVPRLRRVLRQAAAETGKQVRMELDGAHGELDRNVLEHMTAPLEHLMRNAVAHGLETPDVRRKAGKDAEGTVRIRLRREGSEMVLQISDDGAGINHEAIRKRAEARGLIAPGATPSPAELERLILESGFSTAESVSQLAGRGVGMDVVYSEVRQLGGSLDIGSEAGRGTTFTLRLPQTLAVTQAVFVRIGETQFAVPVAAVGGIGRIARERYDVAGGKYLYGGQEYALHDLGALTGHDPAKAEGEAQIPLLLVNAGDLHAAVAVDEVLGNREIVVKPVGPQLASIPGIYGATITGDGSIVVILDAAPLVRRHLSQPALAHASAAQLPEQRRVPLVMVVDDSLTMRKVTGRVLERHNFEVVAARDGVEALERLEERIPDLMLLDIEMPRMDGYELATAMRADQRFRNVPIVMITSRTGDKHRQRAFEIGVQRYMGKPYQELDLMRNVYDLLGIARVRE